MRWGGRLSAFWAKLSSGTNVLIAATRVGGGGIQAAKCILYSTSDGNRGQKDAEGYFSPILDPIQIHYREKSYQAVNLSYPLSCYHSSEIKGGAILLNQQAIGILIVWMLEKIVLGSQRAAERKSGRRVRLLERAISVPRPKLIIAFQATPELCRAAHRLGIAVVEPMHGMHLSPTDQILRSTIIGIERNSLPDAYLAYDDRTAETLRELLGSEKIGVIRLPHPAHIAAQRMPKMPEQQHRASRGSKARKIEVLVTMQWGYDGERESLANIIPNGVMHPALEQAIAESPEVIWRLRLHPVQMRYRRYKKHRLFVKALSKKYPNIEWEAATELPLATMLASVDGHITMTSGSVGEAAIFGVPSLLLCPTLKPGGAHQGWFSELADGGLVEFGELEVACIRDWVQKVGERDSREKKDWKAEEQKFFLALDQLLDSYGRN